MRILSVIVSYERLELLKQTVLSYRETVSCDHRLVVVDNDSGPDIIEWLQLALHDQLVDAVYVMDENRYPGFAANTGWDMNSQHIAMELPDVLHRSDNDVEYLPGWCEEVEERFQDPALGQLGLRTLEEEGPHAAVGGNMCLRRDLYMQHNVRYPGHPWTVSAFEDAQLSQLVVDAGYRWERVLRPCIIHRGIAKRDDPYYQRTFAVRGITFDEWGIE